VQYFEFSQNVIPLVASELATAEQFIKIAMFQIHQSEIFDTLSQKIDQGVKVEILTLPYDSINANVYDMVTKRFKDLELKGAILHFCRWNIGDPERTSTATGRWYSFHGKFIVTDRAAIALSANFTEKCELDAMLIYKDDEVKIHEFNQKFDELLETFVLSFNGYSGKIRPMILNSGYPNAESLFELPKVIESSTHKDHWIVDYPGQLCSVEVPVNDSLSISPFDVRARVFIQSILQKAKKNIYISTESFTDPDIYNDLMKAKLSGITVKILTGSTSMDFKERLEKLLRRLIATGVEVHTTSDPLHAKLVITDNLVGVSSINLNKINLGFAKSKWLWRANTETITISSDSSVINSAQIQFNSIFDQADDIQIYLAEQIEKDIGKIFTQFYGLRTRQEVKTLFSRFFLSQEIEVNKIALDIGRVVKKMLPGKNVVTKNDFVKALILYYLSDNKLTYNSIEEKLSILNTEIELKTLLLDLINQQYIEKQGDYYKLQVLSLF